MPVDYGRVLTQLAELSQMPQSDEQAERQANERQSRYDNLRQDCLERGMSEEEARLTVLARRGLDIVHTPGIVEQNLFYG